MICKLSSGCRQKADGQYIGISGADGIEFIKDDKLQTWILRHSSTDGYICANENYTVTLEQDYDPDICSFTMKSSLFQEDAIYLSPKSMPNFYVSSVCEGLQLMPWRGVADDVKASALQLRKEGL